MSPKDPRYAQIPADEPAPRPSLGGLMKGRRALVTGVANERSIAWAIAEAFAAEGAELAFTYAGESMERRVRPLAETLKPAAILDMDVGRDDAIEKAAKDLGKVWDRLDVLVHSIGYAPREALGGRFTDVTTREVWRIALDISAYSLVGLGRAFKPMMRPGSSIVSLSYYAAEKVVRNYNVMGVAKAALESATRYMADDLGLDGIRVNAISAGPLKTLAAYGIRGMRSMLNENAEKTPLRRNIEQDDVARAALYLCSELARNVTGEVLYVDAGQNILGIVSME
ncbi:MAG TPA: enoyl-ACP reductase [Anaeromyxobacteraceae bacterium]|nr:enoyl-ACP reductase [Anaeromyxobacteraceae bacterium]